MSDQHTTVQYQLRLSPELRDRIKESASAHNRSMNADIVARLESSFDANLELIPLSKYDALYDEYKTTQNLLHEISLGILNLKEAFDSDDNLEK